MAFSRKDEFRYDAGRDAYICPAGQTLKPFRHGRLRDLKKIDYGNPKACRNCPLRARCTTASARFPASKTRTRSNRMAQRLAARPTFSTAAARSSSIPSAASSSG